MPRYLDPKNDLVFKRIFGENPHLLRSILNALMPLEEGQEILTLNYLSPENVPDSPFRKYSVVDVKCTDNRGRQFIVEMQLRLEEYFRERMLHNVTKIYSRQVMSGESYLAPPVYGLGILNRAYDKDTPEYYHRYQLANCSNVREIIGGIEVILVELPKFKPETMTEKRMAALWLQFLKARDEATYKVPEELFESKEIVEALTLCEVGAYTPSQLIAYDDYWKEILSQNSVEEVHKRDLKKAVEEGKAEGKAEGLAEGRAEGLAEGKAEGLAEGEFKAARKIALNLLSKGFSIEDIAESTGLTADEIREIAE